MASTRTKKKNRKKANAAKTDPTAHEFSPHSRRPWECRHCRGSKEDHGIVEVPKKKKKKKRDPFAPGTPGRKCEVCGRGGGVLAIKGHYLHRGCRSKFEKVKEPKEGKSQQAPGPSGPDAELFERWKNGTTIHELVSETKMSRSSMRKLLTKAAGGKDKFKELRAQGAGGKVEPFGGKRASGGRRRKKASDGTTISPDDEGLPVIHSARKSEGWSNRSVLRGKVVNVDKVGPVQWRETVHLVHVAPDGTEYVRAQPNEKADLLYVMDTLGVTVRLRKYEDSRAAKALKKHEKEVARGEKLLEATRKRKRVARKARKARKQRRES